MEEVEAGVMEEVEADVMVEEDAELRIGVQYIRSCGFYTCGHIPLFGSSNSEIVK